MSEPNREVVDAGVEVDGWGLIRAYGRTMVRTAVVAALVVSVLGWLYLSWWQSETRVLYLEFRPTFQGVAQSEYPNGLPFSTTDVTAGPIMDLVYDRSEFEAFCPRDAFRSAFYVEQYSDQSAFLDLEYRARLSEPRLDMATRQTLQQEHLTKRAALPIEYRLAFAVPPSCRTLPQAMATKAMADVLTTWASESEEKRGVLNHQIEVLSPATLDVVSAGPGGWVLGADLLRTALKRVVENIDDVMRIPGTGLVRLGPGRLTFMEVRGKLNDLLSARLEPLVMTSGRSLIKESFVWVSETVASAEQDQRLAERRAAVYRDALREFSGDTVGGDAGGRATAMTPATPGTQALMTQIDRSFIDRLVEMSQATAPYRRELTDAMVEANLEAVSAQNRASYYRRLLQSLREPGGLQLTSEELDDRLEQIVAEGKALTKQFGDLYEELSRVSLRPAGAMYQAPKPVSTVVTRAFSLRALAQLVAAVFVATLFLTLGFCAARDRLIVTRH